ncbi:MAG: hypothetical protein HY815_29755, partial [Candidatus Riflebacteria bacterium]|nr:hypothetical protein [Candidatus Riflebacteria bacterium]
QAQAEIGAWVSLSGQIASAGEELEAACEDVRPGGWCFPVHTNHWTRSWYLFAGLEPVHERLSYGALVPERTGYTKQEDDPRPRVTLTGNYGAAKVMAMTRYVYPLRFVRLDLKPIGETGVQPGHERSIRTLVLAPTRSPPDPESLVILGARVNRDLLPPATYEVRIRAWRLTGVEQIGCQVHGLMIQTQG